MNNFLPEELYLKITQSIPVLCVDMLPVRKRDKGWQIGVIVRATGKEAGKLALVGGRVGYQESVYDAVTRHLLKDLSIKAFSLLPANSINRPFYIQQYFHTQSAGSKVSYDPTKHAVALNYLVTLKYKPKPANEASEFVWLTQPELPRRAAYNQQIVMAEAFEVLNQLR